MPDLQFFQRRDTQGSITPAFLSPRTPPSDARPRPGKRSGDAEIAARRSAAHRDLASRGGSGNDPVDHFPDDGEAGAGTAEVRHRRRVRSAAFYAEGEVRRHGVLRCQAAEDSGRREWQGQAPARRDNARALLRYSRLREGLPFTPLASCHALNFGGAEGVEAVHESNAEVDFCGLTV